MAQKNWRIEDQRRSENAADLLFRHTTVVSVSEVPEGEGIEDSNWVRREGAEVEFRATKPGETLVLRDGNSLVPWANIRRVECNGLTAEELANLLVF